MSAALDDIVSAVGDIVVVFEEAQTNWTTEIMVEGAALVGLTAEIERTVAEKEADSARVEDPELAADLRECNAALLLATSSLERIVKSAPGGIVPKGDYSKLHHELKMILHQLVKQVRIADEVNVGSLMKICKRVFECLVRARSADSAAAVGLVEKEVTVQLKDLVTHGSARVAGTTEADLRGRMDRALQTVRDGVPGAMVSCASTPAGTARDAVLRPLFLAMKELLDCVEQSAEYIRRYELLFPLPEFTARPPRDGPPQVDADLTRLQDAVRQRDGPEATAAARDFAGEAQRRTAMALALAEQTPHAALAAALRRDAEKLTQATPGVVQATKAVLAAPDDAAAQRAFDAAVAEARAVNRRLEELHHKETYPVEMARAVEAALAELHRAVESGDAARIAAAARQAAHVMQEQVAAGRAAAQTMQDPTLKKQVLDACDRLEARIPEVIRATKAAAENPHDAAAQQALRDVTDAARIDTRAITAGILEDELAQNRDQLHDHLAELRAAAAQGDKDAAAAALHKADTAIQRRQALGRELARQTADPQLKRQILAAVDRLEELRPELRQRAQDAVANPRDAAAQRRLQGTAGDVESAAARVTALRLFPDSAAAAAAGSADPLRVPAQALATGRALDAAAERLWGAVKAGDRLAAEAALPETLDLMTRQADNARALAQQLDGDAAHSREAAARAGAAGDAAGAARHAARAAELEAAAGSASRAADALEAGVAEVATTARAAIDDPHNADKEAALRAALDAAKAANGDVMDAAAVAKKATADTATAGERARANAAGFRDAAARLKAAVAAGDREAAAAALRETVDRLREQARLGRQLAQMTDDPLLRERLLGAADALDALAPQIEAATWDALDHPEDASKREKLDALIDEAEVHVDTIARAQDEMDRVRAARAAPARAAERAAAVAKSLGEAGAALLAAVAAGDRVEAGRRTNELMGHIREQIQLGNELLKQTDDADMKKQIRDAIAELEDVHSQIEAAVADALAHPDDAAAQQRLKDLVARADAAGKRIGAAGAEIERRKAAAIQAAKDAEAAARARAEAERKAAEEAARAEAARAEAAARAAAEAAARERERASEYTADGKRDEVMVAAHSVEDALDRQRAARIPEQKSLNEIAQQIAIEMEKLSLAARESNKRDMVDAAKRIAALIDKVETYAEQIASRCNHPGLADELRSVAGVPKNFATQLNIVSAVADHGGSARSAASQLVVCARGLANSVIGTVNAAEAAALRVPRGSAAGAAAAGGR